MAAPFCIAAIDVGSSAARVSIARTTVGGPPHVLYHHRYPVRLGQGAFDEGGMRELGPTLVAALLEAAAGIRDRMDAYHVRAARAVATSAMREAANGAEVALQVGRVLGVRLEVIDGEEEADLSRRALLTAIGRAGETLGDKALLLDLGGGSLEIAAARGTPRASLPLGTVRLLSRLPSLAAPLDAAALHSARMRVQQWVREALAATSFGQPPTAWAGACLVGTGGNLEVMARLLPAPAGAKVGIDAEAARALLPRIAAIGVAERATTYGLRPERADLMLPALLIIEQICQAFDSAFVRVPGTGLRDAMLQALSLKLPRRSG